MLTLQKQLNKNNISISTENRSIDNLLKKQWLLTNGRGGYASSTIGGCNTSSYHGLLIGTLDPPVKRIMALSNCLDMIIYEGKVYNLSTYEFSDRFAPADFICLKQFRKNTGVHFDYELNISESNLRLNLTKSIYLLRDQDICAIVYNFTEVPVPIEFIIRPLAGLRDFHSIQKSSAHMDSISLDQGVSIRNEGPESCELLLTCPSAKFVKDPQWWFNFIYRDNRERGLNHAEDLWSPGFFKCSINTPSQVVLWASLYPLQDSSTHNVATQNNINSVRKNLQEYDKSILTGAEIEDISLAEIIQTLYLAADQFIVKRNKNNYSRTSIVAGYPWFMDWGRDAFISLPGLLLSTGRLEEAKSVLTTFASALDEGMIPSRFDDDKNTACFNSVDASLWFIIAAFQYLKASNDLKTFTNELVPAIEGIINAYQKGTRFNIHADSDGLISAGNEQTQLTWMDAKYDGITFTPRYGKPVEVNALWYNSLLLMAEFVARNIESRVTSNESRFESMADQVKVSFNKLFWNAEKNYLNDCITPDGKIDDSLRPNQIFAVSLEYSPLTEEQQKSVVKVVQENLLTPYGLRTLNISAANYKGLYTGSQRFRDEAYHQGTVWPFLMGPFIDAYMKVNKFSGVSKKNAIQMIQPLLKHLTEDSCLGNISEIFDGDPPHNPKGCFAQAWSVGEVIRACKLLNS